VIADNFFQKFKRKFFEPWQESVLLEEEGKTPLSIALVNQKGGVGKTTIAINLAAAIAQHRKNVLLVDGDPQSSAKTWFESVTKEQPFKVLNLFESSVVNDITDSQDHKPQVIIDCPPTLNKVSQTVLSGIKLALIPVTPSPLDIWSAKGTVEMIREAQIQNQDLKARFLISRKIVNTKLGDAVKEALAQYKVPVLKTEITQRASLQNALMAGKNIFQFAPQSDSAFEFDCLCLELSKLRWAKG
jgi:chromosome partitioning protein